MFKYVLHEQMKIQLYCSENCSFITLGKMISIRENYNIFFLISGFTLLVECCSGTDVTMYHFTEKKIMFDIYKSYVYLNRKGHLWHLVLSDE